MSGTAGFKDYFAAWDQGDADAIMAWLTDDAVFEDVPSGHVARGAGEVRAFVEGALGKAPGARYEIVTSQADADSFAVEWIMQPAGLRGASVGSLRDGRICANRDYWNAGGRPA